MDEIRLKVLSWGTRHNLIDALISSPERSLSAERALRMVQHLAPVPSRCFVSLLKVSSFDETLVPRLRYSQNFHGPRRAVVAKDVGFLLWDVQRQHTSLCTA